ncbi:hypothetical protein GGR51DRAFT_574123 [Nemania sp. FL0031]|nr:hypothetical protein GGR51DRAFT_574123 [Nemania sp. FL0031]
MSDQILTRADVATGGMAEDTTSLFINAPRSSTGTNQLNQPSTTSDTPNEDRDKKAPKRRPIQNLPFGITLNGVVSILTTAYKASLLYAISAALGQSKWDWYACEARRLSEFDRIDEVSRGPLGAIRFLFGRTNKISIVSLSSIIVVLALLIDPFSQQLVHFTRSPVVVESDTVWTEVFTNVFEDPEPDYFKISRTLNGAIWNNASAYDRKVHCPTGNCTFPPFKTSEWCSKTETIDVSRVSTNCSLTTYNPEDFAETDYHYNKTGEMISQDQTCGWFLDNSTTPLTTFPSTKSLLGGTQNVVEFPSHYAVVDYSWTSYDYLCKSRLNISCPPLTVSYVSVDFEGSIQRMEQSALTLCTTEYEIAVNSGVQKYQAIRSRYGRFRLNETVVPVNVAKRNEATEQVEVVLDGICFTSSYDDDLYPLFPNDTDSREILVGNTTLSFCWSIPVGPLGYNDDSHREWRFWFDGLEDIFNDFRNRPETASYTDISWNFNGEFDGSFRTDGNQFLNIIKAKGLREFMIGITASMNSAWRTRSQEKVTGSFIYNETILEISWAWVILPIALNVLGYVVLVSVIRNSMKISQGKLWKGSTLASLYHGLQEDCILGNMDTIEAMEKAAAMTLVELKFVDKEDRVLLSK